MIPGASQTIKECEEVDGYHYSCEVSLTNLHDYMTEDSDKWKGKEAEVSNMAYHMSDLFWEFEQKTGNFRDPYTVDRETYTEYLTTYRNMKAMVDGVKSGRNGRNKKTMQARLDQWMRLTRVCRIITKYE
jgi:hypothetical protein